MLMDKLRVTPEQIEGFCRRWDVVGLAFFGSVLRDDFGPDSDVDAMVTFPPEAHRDLFDLVEMQDELAALLGRPVDLVTRAGVEHSSNWIRRRAILESREAVYGEE
jgi:predicted nucleotidyltransferase